MTIKFAFQSSLPRSGSTLLSNIVGQNPDFHVTPTSGLLDLLYVSRTQFTRGLEFNAQDKEEMNNAFAGFCRGGIEGYASALTDKPWFFDKCRGWNIHYHFLCGFYPNPKIVSMIRDPLDVLCSMERNFRKSKFQDPGIVEHGTLKNTTVAKRVDHWIVAPPVGMAMERLQEVINMGIDDKMLFIQYEDLCASPQVELERFYSYLDLPYYEGHDYDNVEQITVEDDTIYGVFGDHKIRKQVKPQPSCSQEIFGSELCEYIRSRYGWYYKRFGQETS
jgi:sulfotransferase